MNGAGILTFLTLASVLLWFIISGRGRWWPKLIAILGVFAFGAMMWFSALSFTGWPTTANAPDLSLFVAGYAVEPDFNQEGAIYIWLVSPPKGTTIYEYQSKDGEPRAYVLQYSREMHEAVQAATAATAQDQRVAFSPNGPPDGGQEVGGQNRDGRPGDNGTNDPSHNQGGSQGTRGGSSGFYILPESSPYSKG